MQKVKMYFVGDDGKRTLFSSNMEKDIDWDRLEKQAKEASAMFKKEVAVSIETEHREEFVKFEK